MFRWKRYIIESFVKNGRLLDIGSGTNSFIQYMNKNNWKADSYDNFTNSTIESIDSCNENYYDVITLWHSLEHIHNINDIFLKIKELLKPNGILIVACPNIESIDCKLLGTNWVAYDVPRHLYHFSYDSFYQLTKKYNFHINSHYRMLQDMFFNVIQSKNVNIFYKLFSIFISFIVIIFNKKQSSSFLYVCKLD